ncbi:hypothetical protein M3Y97_00073200 [Aphelenchoides bicaudatus]|nr:hypothetical protein M3Y97_00073200 [Aphelenchoides bicaudatus]
MDDGQKLKSIKLDDDSELKDASKLPKKLPKKKVEDEGGLESIQLKPVIKRSQKESDDVEDYKLKPTQFDEKALVDGNRESISLKKVPADQNNDERSLKSSDFESKDSSDVKPKQNLIKTEMLKPKDNDGQELKTIDLEPKDDDGHNLKSTDLDSKDSSDSLKKVSRDVKPKEEFDKNSISLKKVSRDVKPKDDDKEIISLKKVPKDDGHNLKSPNFDSEPKDVISTIDSDQISSEQKLKSPDFDSEPKDSSDSLNKSPKDVKSTIDSDSEPKVSLKKVPTESTIDSDSEPKVSPKKSPKEDVQKPKSPDFEPKVSLKKVPTESTTDDKDIISLNKAPKAEFDDDSLSKSSKLGDDSASKVMDNIDSLKPKDAGDKSSMDDEKLLKKISKPKVDDDDSIKHDKSLKALPETGADQDNLSKLDDATTFDSKSLKKSPKRIEDSKHKLEEVPKDDQLTKSTISNEKLKKKPKTLAEQASNLDDVYSTAPESQIDSTAPESQIDKPKTKLKKKKVKQPSDDTPQPMTKDEILEDHKKDPFFISEEVTPSSKISDSVDTIDDTQQPTTKEEPIQFIKSLEPSTIGHVGEVIELSVELSRPAQEFKWLFNQREVPLSSDEYRVNVKGNQLSLEILNPTFDMSGTYSVVADDAVTSTQLDFHGQPVLEDSADSAIELNAKDDLKLKCNFKANPKPDIQILLNNEPLDDPEAFVEVETDTITLSRPTVTRKNSGIYSFVVRNTYGKGRKACQNVPEAPQNLKVESFGSDFVEISWMPPESGSSSLLHYRIEMKEAKRRVFQRAGQVPANTTRFRIEGLDIDRLYMFKVAAINKFGTGEFCTPVEQTTNVPFEAPQIEKPPRIVSIDEKMCKLEWSPCSNTGGSPIYSYDVYMREGDSGDWVKVNDDEVFVPSFSIKDRLEPGKSYSFKIEATNEAGISSDSNVPTESVLCPKSKSILTRIFSYRIVSASVDIFDAPTVEVTSPNSVNVKWDRPADLPADQKLKSVVFYKSEQSPVWNKLLTTDDELEISDLKPELAYIFRVETELPDSTTLSSGETSPVSLTTAEKPRITKPLKDVNAIKSNELRLEVQALSEPAPSFEWTKDGREVSGAQISNDGTSSVLTISFANDADQGLYTCKVTNVHGSVESSAQISVKQPPINILTAFPESLNTTTGTELELACELSHEDATVNWLKNGQPLFESDRIQFVEVGTKRQLIIKNAEKEDSADYVCVSTDGNSRARCKVSVKEPEAHVKFGPEDQTITSIGETAAVECELTSPVETLCWLQNGRPIDLNSPKYTVVNDGLKCTLKIADFDKSAVGDYVLQLPNGELSVPANLQLKIPAKIEVDFDELFAHAGKELSFAVRVSGFPIPAFNATLNGVPLKDFALIDDIDEENIKVTIKSAKPEHAGELTLKVKNDSNEDSKSIPVKVASVPQQPANVSATLVNEDSCEVRWSPNKEDENAPIAEYIIERKAGDQTRWRQCGQIDARRRVVVYRRRVAA